MCDIDLKVVILSLTVAAIDAEWMECLEKCQKIQVQQMLQISNSRDQQIKAVIHTFICDDPKVYSGRF